MLEVGVAVYVKTLFKEDRPELPEHSAGYERKSGYIRQDLGDDYFLVESIIDDTMCVAHKDELIDMTMYKNRYKLGDEVRICQAGEEEKHSYSNIINIEKYVDLSPRYNGRATYIEHIMNSYPDMYLLEGLPGVWNASNLKPTIEFVGF